jgi:hypothetical protein
MPKTTVVGILLGPTHGAQGPLALKGAWRRNQDPKPTATSIDSLMIAIAANTAACEGVPARMSGIDLPFRIFQKF